MMQSVGKSNLPVNTKLEQERQFKNLQQERTILLHKQQEAERKREELIRSKEKEVELQRLGEEKRRRDEAARRKDINAKREKIIRAKLLRRIQTQTAQEAFLQEKVEQDQLKNEKRDSIRKDTDAKVESLHSKPNIEREDVGALLKSIRRVFVLLDVNGDGIITDVDLTARLERLGCKLNKGEAQRLPLDVIARYGSTPDTRERDRRYWLWNMEMYQPSNYGRGEAWSPGWSRNSTAGLSDDEIVDGTADMSRDLAKLFKTPPAIAHLKEMAMWNRTCDSRIITLDSVDCATKEQIQHPPVLSPRTPLDFAPQDDYNEMVCPVVLTESGLMTSIDLKAHLKKHAEGLNWTEFRDCVISYQADSFRDKNPSKLFSIVDFLLLDHLGVGTVDLIDVMELLFQKFGELSDAIYLQIYGNSFDPSEQVSLQSYLDKLEVLILASSTTKRK